MPEKPNVKKVPKKAVIPIAVGVLVLLALYLRSRKKATEGNATELGTQGLSNQSFIPVTGENVAGAGAGNIGAVPSNEGSNNTALLELIKTERATQLEREKAEKEFLRDLITNLGTGGGAPTTGGVTGVIATPPQGGATPATGPAPGPAPSPGPTPHGCPPSFPNRGPHGCWRWSRTKTGQGCSCHGYQNGVLECEHKVNGRCTW